MDTRPLGEENGTEQEKESKISGKRDEMTMASTSEKGVMLFWEFLK